MPTIQQLLYIDLSLLAVLFVSVVLLLRRALKQGRAKRALENSLASAHAPIATMPYVTSRTASQTAVTGTITNEAAASVFAPQHAVPATRRPLWSDTIPVVTADPWIDDVTAASAPESDQEVTAAETPQFVFALDASAAGIDEETSATEEEHAVPALPREQVGILFLEDDQDIASLRLAEVTQITPRKSSEEAAAQHDQPERAPVEFIDGIYADPIDGIPFTPGEEVIPCACGTAYRLDTAAYLREEANGECVQCHRPLTTETIRVAEESLRMAQSA